MSSIINGDRPDGIWTVLVKGFSARMSESVAITISQDSRVDAYFGKCRFFYFWNYSSSPNSHSTPSSSQLGVRYKLVEQDNAVYKEPADIYKEPVGPDKLPQEKFRKGNPKAIPGEYIVILPKETYEGAG